MTILISAALVVLAWLHRDRVAWALGVILGASAAIIAGILRFGGRP